MKCRRIFALALAIALLALALTGCGSKDNGSAADGDTVTVKLGVVGAIYDDIWKPAQEALKAEGINLEIVQFSDYVTPNNALANGEIDLNAEKDGVWDSSYVSTGVRDPGVEDILGSDTRKSSLNANGEVNGYAIKGVEFTYLKVADIRTYTEEENSVSHVEVLYGIAQNDANDAFLSAIGVSAGDRYVPADSADGTMHFYRSDTLINGLKSALASNAITVKNALERFVRENGGTAMPLTVVNARGFNLPQTGGHGIWMYGAVGTVLMVAAAIILVSARRKKLEK